MADTSTTSGKVWSKLSLSNALAIALSTLIGFVISAVQLGNYETANYGIMYGKWIFIAYVIVTIVTSGPDIFDRLCTIYKKHFYKPTISNSSTSTTT